MTDLRTPGQYLASKTNKSLSGSPKKFRKIGMLGRILCGKRRHYNIDSDGQDVPANIPKLLAAIKWIRRHCGMEKKPCRFSFKILASFLWNGFLRLTRFKTP
jgi:hypothetical protein